MTKKLWVAAAIVGGLGFLAAIGFQIAAGVQYRIAEDHGVDPGYSPTWIVIGTNTGLLLFVIGLGLLLIAGLVAIFTHRHRLSSHHGAR